MMEQREAYPGKEGVWRKREERVGGICDWQGRASREQ